jgi:hypothetical protein
MFTFSHFILSPYIYSQLGFLFLFTLLVCFLLDITILVVPRGFPTLISEPKSKFIPIFIGLLCLVLPCVVLGAKDFTFGVVSKGLLANAEAKTSPSKIGL